MAIVQRDGFRPGAQVQLYRRGALAGRDVPVGSPGAADGAGRVTVDVTGLSGSDYFLSDGSREQSLSLAGTSARLPVFYDDRDARLETGSDTPLDSVESAIPASISDVAYDGDGNVLSITENGVTTTYTYNAVGDVATETRLGVTRTFQYTAGVLTGATTS